MPPITTITADEAMQIHPGQYAPPMCTTDGHEMGVGIEHGRALPLVGNTRPYFHDVVILNTPTRIYADTLTDVVSMLIGEEYQRLVVDLAALQVSEPVDSGSITGYGDVLPDELAAGAAIDDDPAADPDQIRRHQQAQLLLVEMALLRTAFADDLRLQLQDAINAEAVADGSWEHLSDAERSELLASAARDGGFPIGIPAEVPFLDDSADPPVMRSVIRPEWRSQVPLVINTGDYLPWTPAPFITFIRDAVDAVDGTRFEYETNENSVVLDPDTEDAFIASLVSVGYLSHSVYPAYQPDEIYRSMTDDPIVNPYLRRNRVADAGVAQHAHSHDHPEHDHAEVSS